MARGLRTSPEWMTEVFTVDAGAIRLSLRLGWSPRSAEIARHAVRAVLGRTVGGQFADAATLCTSELVTNAIVHTGRGCELQMSFDPLDGGVLRVEVSDSSPELPHVTPPGDVRRIGGRGLRIVEETSTRWGSTQVAGGKVVWFELVSAALPAGGTVEA